MRTKALATLLLLVCLASTGFAALLEKTSQPELFETLKTEGYAASIDDDGKLIWKIEGYRAILHVGENGSNILFRVSIQNSDATLKTVNKWNMDMSYSRSYIDDDGDVNLELDIDLDGGIGHARLLDYLKTCRVSFTRWLTDVVHAPPAK